MKKNEFNIKNFYITQFVKYCQDFSKHPEHEVRLKKFDELLSRIIKSKDLNLTRVFAYYFDRILSGEECKYYFVATEGSENMLNEPMLYKLNLIQLKYSAEVMNKDSELEDNVIDFVYSFGGAVQQFLRSYYMNKNLTHLRVKDMQKLYDKYKLKDYIVEPQLSDFKYDEIKVKKEKKQRELKTPAILFLEESPDMIMFVKYDGQVKWQYYSDKYLDIKADLEGVLRSYENIAIVGSLKDNTINTYICTTKAKVCKGLFKDNRFTLQNNFKYLVGDFNRVNRSIRLNKDWLNLKPLTRAEGRMYWDMLDILHTLKHRETGCILFRNEFLELPKGSIVVSKQVVKEIDFIRGKVMLENVISKKENIFELKQYVGDGAEYLDEGTELDLIKIKDYQFLIDREN